MSQPRSPRNVLLFYTLNNQDFSIVLDAVINEHHVGTAQITDHQVETGSNITDHIRPLNQRLTLDAFVTNTPIAGEYKLEDGSTKSVYEGVSGSVRSLNSPKGTQALQFDSDFDRVNDVFSNLVSAYRQGALFTVTTTLKTYEGMAIANISVPRNAQNGNAIQFTIDMQEVRTVDVQTVETAPKTRKKKRSQQPPKTADDKTKEQTKTSFLKALVSG